MPLFGHVKFSLRNIDWILVLSMIILVAIGLAAIYSVDLSRGGGLDFFPTQIVALILGTIVLIIAASIHSSVYQGFAPLMYVVGILLLLGVLFFGVTVRGTTGWFRIAGFSFQPVEFVKVALVLFLADWMYRYNRRFYTWQFIVSSGFLAGLCIALVLLQPDFGSAFILGSIWFGLLLVSGTKKRYIFGIVAAGIAVALFAWFFVFADYQKARVMTFVNPELDPLGSGYNVTQSIIAIGSGHVFGRGLGFGSQSQLHFLPEAQTDFIFSVIGEELGFVGAFLLLTIYFVFLWRFIRIALQANNDFAAFTVYGILLLFFVQMVVNIGGTTGLLPVTGVTLPFVSYGGSSLIMNFFLVGIALSQLRSSTRSNALREA